MHSKATITTFIFCCLVSVAWTYSDAIKLTEYKAFSLHQGMTKGRRSDPVPQLKCAGGTAGCTTYVPQVVQCQNMGFDGIDVHWKCDDPEMGKNYRFGYIEVGCEGYMHPDDPYVLKGSCGLVYTLDLTEEGHYQLNNRIQLKNGQVLDLTEGVMTIGRRLSPISQLECVGGTAGCRTFAPEKVKCYNRGFDGKSMQWDCQARLNNLVKFGEIDVQCEPFMDAKDTFILKGSCGLKYTLDWVKQQPRVYIDDNRNKSSDSDGSSLIALWIILGIFGGLIVIGLIIYGIVVCVQSDSDGGSSGGYRYRSKTYVSEPSVLDVTPTIVVSPLPVFPSPSAPPYFPTPSFYGPTPISPSSGTRIASGFGGTTSASSRFKIRQLEPKTLI